MYEEFLHKVAFFAELPPEDLTRLCRMVKEVRLRAGEVLVAEGARAEQAFIIYEGQLEVLKNMDGHNVLIDVQEVPGTVIGEMALLEDTTRLATVRARSDALVLALGQSQFHELLNISPTAARIMLHTLVQRWRGLEAAVRHGEQMARLGTLTAGIAHELNNPAAAVQRGAAQLQESWTQAEQARLALERLELSEAQQEKLNALTRQVRTAAASPLVMDTLARSDREAELEGCLDELGVSEGWMLAPVLVNLNLGPADLSELEATFTPEQLRVLFAWLEATCTVQGLFSEISAGAGRITEIVKALKTYVYLDQGPTQDVDIHLGLQNTLVILRSKVPAGVSIIQEYASDLPKIPAYGSELNQVWTNILDNALDAVGEQGTITIRTYRDEDDVVVEFEDNGPGIPPAVQRKVFDPFFTTKPPGQGSGLGLNISHHIIVRKHRGSIDIASAPGRTRFIVRLPVNPPTE